MPLFKFQFFFLTSFFVKQLTYEYTCFLNMNIASKTESLVHRCFPRGNHSHEFACSIFFLHLHYRLLPQFLFFIKKLCSLTCLRTFPRPCPCASFLGREFRKLHRCRLYLTNQPGQSFPLAGGCRSLHGRAELVSRLHRRGPHLCIRRLEHTEGVC